MALEYDKGPSVHDPKAVPVSIKKDKATVASKSKAYKSMYAHWKLPIALRGGTLKMREGSTEWLPQEPKESVDAYQNRLNRTFCYGAYNRTVETLSGLPFMRPAIVDGLPDELEYLKWDCDSSGTDLTNFAHSLLDECLDLGITHILVDMPYFEGEPTLEEQDIFKLRPYFVKLSPTNLIGWTVKRIGGLDFLSSIRIEETVTESDGEWGEKEIKQIRVITQESHTLYRETEKDKWAVYNTIPNNLGKIPLITVYGNKTGFLQAKPPLEDLAFLNLQHYQQLSDLNNIQHVANVPIGFGAGFAEGELDGVEIGPNRWVIASAPDANLKYVEHTGSAISASQKSIEMLENRMAAMGADLIVRKSVDRQTATARLLDSTESVSMLQIMINNIEEAIEKAIDLAGEWINIEVEDVRIEIGDNLRLGAQGPNSIDILAQYVLENEGITLEQAVKELQRRGFLVDSFKLKKEGDLPLKKKSSENNSKESVNNSGDDPEGNNDD